MAHTWIFLALLAAFGQALGWALKKKTLESKGVNNSLGVVSFLVAGLLLFFMFWVANGAVLPVLTTRFWQAALIVILTNILAVWMAYKALDRAPLSLLLPFIAVSSLGMIPVEYFARGVLPNGLQVAGIFFVVVGSVFFTAKEMPHRENLRAMAYFAVTVLCFSISSPYMGVAVDEVHSGLFAAAVFHLGISLGFVPLVFLAREGKALQRLQQQGLGPKLFGMMVASGCCIALLENGPATVALLSAKASEVFALKRLMPFFGLGLGVLMFNEKVTRHHILPTFLLVAGSALIVWFR